MLNRVEPLRAQPSSHRRSRRRRLASDGAHPKFAIDGDRQARLVTGTSSAVSVEQYRKLAAVLHEEQVRSQLKTVIVTSALPGEGKTLTAVNLALTLSESYARRVLIIDADLRGPSLHTALDIPNDHGLSEALNGRPAVVFRAGVERPPRSSRRHAGTDAVGRPDLRPHGRDSRTVRVEVRLGLIDTPPVGVLPDAQVLARLAGAVLFVIGAGSTPAAAVERAIAELGGPDAIFGVVLNRIDEWRIPSASYYGHYQKAPPK